MAEQTGCKTPGAVFHTHVQEEKITIEIDLPKGVLKGISEIQAEDVEFDLHNALEMALAPYFVAWDYQGIMKRMRSTRGKYNEEGH